MSKDGLCVIVTGSASGLGATPATILAKAGARIVINYSSSQKEAKQTAELCRKAAPRWWWCRATCRATRIARRSSRLPRPGAGSMR